jgi:hypothetical protein
MKILVVPDIHENLEFLKYIFAVEDTKTFDHIVLLGDYFDPPGEVNPCEKRLQQMAGTLMGFKEIFGERLHMLCGNHDLPYYALRPACGGRNGEPNSIISNWLGNTTLARAEIINELWDDAFWQDLKGAVFLDGWLFSHAGVHPDWWTHYGETTAARYLGFQREWDAALANIFNEALNPLFTIGQARGGDALIGSPLWQDWDEEFEDALEVPQIVGHTRCVKQTQEGRSYCIDMAQTAYVIVEDGDVQLNIWPDSWLGESLLDSV